jgi:hypothetical protein
VNTRARQAGRVDAAAVHVDRRRPVHAWTTPRQTPPDEATQHLGERGDPSEANKMLGAPPTALHRRCEEQRLYASENRGETHRRSF